MSRINEEQWGEFLAELNARNAAVPPPATPQEPEPYGPFFDPCGKCVTRTHCAHNDRCLAECVPADLRASAPPDVWQPIETAVKAGISRVVAEHGDEVFIAEGFSGHDALVAEICFALRRLPSPPTPGGK